MLNRAYNEVYREILNLQELTIKSIETLDKSIEIYCESKFAESHCPFCLNKCSEINQNYERTIRDLPISGKNVFLHLKSYQYKCYDCNCYFYERFNFVEKNQQLTKRYEQYIYDRCIGVDLRYVCIKEDLCWKVVNGIFTKWSKREIKAENLFADVRALGIDEIALKKGHNDYVCVLVDLEKSQIIDILEDRKKEFLESYFKKLGNEFCDKIEVFSSDMWNGYINTAKSFFPNASIVIDRFHFFGQLQRALDKCRKDLRNKYLDKNKLKGKKWLLLKNAENLSEEEKKELKELFENNEFKELEEIYNSRNEFRLILEKKIDKESAEIELTNWEKKH